jgi:predicted Ser/Thr protein kinase
MKAETALAFAQPGSTDAPRAAVGRGAEIFSIFSMAYARERREAMSLTEFLDGCRDDPGMTASAAERMIAAIGDPVVVDTARDPRLGRIFLNWNVTPSTGLRGGGRAERK